MEVLLIRRSGVVGPEDDVTEMFPTDVTDALNKKLNI